MSELKDVFQNSVEQIKLGEYKFNIKRLTLGDIADFQRWCDKQRKKEIIEIYTMAGQTPNVKEIMDISGDENYYQNMMNTVDGIVYILHKNIHKNNKTNITEEEINDNLTADNMENIVNILFGDFLEKAEEEEKKTAKKTKGKSQQKK